MIEYGTLAVEDYRHGAPTIDLGLREEVTFRGGRVLQTVYELTFAGYERRLPPALHPTHPPLAVIFFYEVPESEVGPFTVAQVRVSALAGLSRFTYPVRSWTDSPDAAALFASRWGYRLEKAGVRVHRGYDAVWGTVEAGGRVLLESRMYDPEPVAGVDANHSGHLNVAYVPGIDADTPVLVQTGPQLQFSRCDRGRPVLAEYDTSAIGGDRPYWPVSAYAGQCDLKFTPIEFVCDPQRPALDGGMTLSGGMHSI